MKPKDYAVLQMAVEEGVGLGVHRAFKHTDKPDRQTVIDNVEQEVMSSIHSWFEFDEVNNEI